jgi:hypothetical protein
LSRKSEKGKGKAEVLAKIQSKIFMQEPLYNYMSSKFFIRVLTTLITQVPFQNSRRAREERAPSLIASARGNTGAAISVNNIAEM